MSESDWPEDAWASAHEYDLIGLSNDQACTIVSAAGSLPAIFEPRQGHALALLKVNRQVLMFSDGRRITGVRVPRPRR